MKKIRVLCLLLCIVLLLGTVPQTSAEPVDQSVTNGCHSVQANMMLSNSGKLADTSKAVILYERNSETMLYAWNPDEKVYPSSMVKLMTALLALENSELNEKVTVTSRALGELEQGATSAGLEAGEELPMEELLYLLLTQSANDAAAVIAEHVGGSNGAFVKMMNKRAQELGCTGTSFANAHGLHHKDSYTTARDICLILDTALDHPVFKEIFTTAEHTVPATNKSEERTCTTSNRMMLENQKKYYDTRVTGGRTGYTKEAGRCLAVTAEYAGMELIGIVMGAEATYEVENVVIATYGSFEEMAILLDYAFDNYEFRQLFYEGQVISQHPVVDGANSVATHPSRTAATVLPKDLDETKLDWLYGEVSGMLSAPIDKEQKVSTIQVWYGSKCLAQADLLAANAVDRWQQLPEYVHDPNHADAGSWTVLLIVVGVLGGIGLAVFGVLLAIRMIRKAQIDARRRSRRQSRRRSR